MFRWSTSATAEGPGNAITCPLIETSCLAKLTITTTPKQTVSFILVPQLQTRYIPNSILLLSSPCTLSVCTRCPCQQNYRSYPAYIKVGEEVEGVASCTYELNKKSGELRECNHILCQVFVVEVTRDSGM